MSKGYCVICQNEVDDYAWKHRKWGKEVGWACSKHFNPEPLHVMSDFVSDEIKEQRVKYAKEQVQAYRQGEFSQEYAKIHPARTKKMVESGILTQAQVDKAKPVWKGDMKGLEDL